MIFQLHIIYINVIILNLLTVINAIKLVLHFIGLYVHPYIFLTILSTTHLNMSSTYLLSIHHQELYITYITKSKTLIVCKITIYQTRLTNNNTVWANLL